MKQTTNRFHLIARVAYSKNRQIVYCVQSEHGLANCKEKVNERIAMDSKAGEQPKVKVLYSWNDKECALVA